MTINERIKEVRKSQGLTLEKFGEHIGLKKTSLSSIETGINGVSNQVVLSICREFNINEEWLRSGTGDMHPALTKAEAAAEVVGRVLGDASTSDFALSTFIELGKLDAKEWEVVRKFVHRLADADKDYEEK